MFGGYSSCFTARRQPGPDGAPIAVRRVLVLGWVWGFGKGHGYLVSVPVSQPACLRVRGRRPPFKTSEAFEPRYKARQLPMAPSAQNTKQLRVVERERNDLNRIKANVDISSVARKGKGEGKGRWRASRGLLQNERKEARKEAAHTRRDGRTKRRHQDGHGGSAAFLPTQREPRVARPKDNDKYMLGWESIVPTCHVLSPCDGWGKDRPR